MNIIITGKNIEVSDYLRALVDKKVGKLERYFLDTTDVYVTLCVERNRHICEVTIPFDGVVIRGEEVTGDMYASVDNVLDKLEKQIHKHRTKLARKLRDEAFEPSTLIYSSEQPAQVEELPSRKLVRTKRFAVKPMNTEEAVMQMELLGHSFFVFFNSDTEEVNVLYLRADGNLGLIEPDFDADED